MDIEFLANNWHLFVALVVIVALLLVDPIRRRTGGVKSISAVEVPQLINHESAIVLDVCEVNEFKKGHIPDAINIPVGTLADNLSRLEKYKKNQTPIVLSCRSGQRSTKAAGILKKNEFANLYTLSGGMMSWEKENLPVEH